MLIVHLITELERGGAEGQLYELVSHSDKSRFRHIVISLQDGGGIATQLLSAGIEVYSLGLRKTLPSPWAYMRLVRLLRNLKPDVLHCWLYHGCLAGALSARAGGVKRMIWGLRSANPGLKGYSSGMRTLIRLCAKFSRCAWMIVANSETSQRLHASWGFRSSAMRVIPNGVDTARFSPDVAARAAVRDELGLPSDSVLIGLFARYKPAKDHETFLQSASRVYARDPRTRFALAGIDIVADNLALTEMVRTNDLEGAVLLLGERRDVPQLTAALDLACISSRHESLSNSVLEAMACEVPCVVTDVGDLASVIGGAGRVVPPGAPDKLAEAMLRILCLSPAQRSAMGHEGRKRILALFSVERAVAEYEQIYEQSVWDNANMRSLASIKQSAGEMTANKKNEP
jgi:glycosyltransferase involved in cell wall biosynthesis